MLNNVFNITIKVLLTNSNTQVFLCHDFVTPHPTSVTIFLSLLLRGLKVIDCIAASAEYWYPNGYA